ncbi:YdgA family protein [Undibacterium sp. Di27W]|uniref:YdgA family protein n=1 Tax=Undibacterium sp. Di27W TaxID=3413036 RepID=UPI003BF2678F
MNKSTKLIAVVVALAASYPAASWYTGKRVEAKLTESNDQAKSSPYVKVVKQDYKRGVFSSVQDTTLELTLANFPGAKKSDLPLPEAAETPEAPADGSAPVDPAAATANVEAKEPKPLQIHFINYIQHGPLPGFAGFGAASIKTELVLDAESKAELAKVFGNASPLEISSRLSYGGGGRVTVSSPAFNTVLEKDQEKVAWQGLKMEVGFGKDYKDVNINLNAPGLTIDTPDGKAFKFAGISVKGDVSAAYPATNLYLGKTESTIASISFADPAEAKKSFTLEQLKLTTDANLKDDLFDMLAKFGIGKVVIDQQTYSDFHYDYGVRRLHAPSLAKISTAYSKTGGDPEKMAALKTVWDEVAPLVLQKEPELFLDRLSVMTPDGEAKLSGTAKVVGATAADFNNPMLMLSKIQSSLDVTLTEGLVAKLGGASQKDPDIQKAAMDAMNQQVSAFVERGYINKNGKLLSSKIEWKQGNLTVNGKPFSR